ncbi:UDP-glucose dehydrogenase family protein [Brevibacillus migulae]|uniref:UDP-glucose dehydrogenase family protein n=1 Tax=Brevibacillus migulae TaxID=1644114 RepID=UPI00106E6910|nr:UDP-glucose/GDP-mannose dehydrogenase family protein [Brevibacillus migulae]
MNLLVIGTGYVGLTTAVSFAMQGHHVTGIDVIEEKVKLLQQGKSPIYEPGLEPELQRALTKETLAFSTSMAEHVGEADVIYLCVGTPSGSDGFADLRYLEQAVETLRTFVQASEREHVVVIKSTVPVGTSDRIAAIFAEDKHVHVVTNPEFLREGRALQDSLEPSRIVIGADRKEAIAIMDQLYAKITAPRVYTTRTNAEMIKYASNAFLATRISFMNELARLCHTLGADIEVVAEGMGLDSRIGPEFLGAGVGYGGSCFPKDTEALIQLARRHQSSLSLLETVRDVNRSQVDWFVERMVETIQGVRQKRIALLGLSFKPETDDIREAPSLTLIERLQKEGAILTAFDPIASLHVKQLYPNLSYVSSPYDALKNADAAILVTEWKECVQLDWQRVKQQMAQPVLFDGRNAWPAGFLKENGFTYLGVGRHA